MNGHKLGLSVMLVMCIAFLPCQANFAYAKGPAEAELQPAPQAPIKQQPAKRAAIVIDDFGSDMKGTKEILSLPIPLTVAVMPFLPTTHRDAKWAHQRGHQVFVHLPMEPKYGRKSWLGPGAITTDLPDEEIRRRVRAAIDDVPYAVGMNNHMGSKATGDKRVMRIVMEVCRERGLIFLDSKTNYRSVGKAVAREVGVVYVENILFLDDVLTVKQISRQLEKIREYLKDHDQCIAIGHVGTPGPKTSSVLKDRIPSLQKDIQFVTVSELAR
jgi:polysaccharide deacetylase 2 family uncharacterized protein YibQ